MMILKRTAIVALVFALIVTVLHYAAPKSIPLSASIPVCILLTGIAFIMENATPAARILPARSDKMGFTEEREMV